MRIATHSLAVLVCAGAWILLGPSAPRISQDLPALPGPGNQTYSLPNSGGFLEIKWTTVDSGEDVPMYNTYEQSCDRICKGNVHLGHEQCNVSCDRNCTKIHKWEMGPEVTIPEGGHQMGLASQRFGSEIDGYGTAKAVVDMAMAPFKNNPKMHVKFQMGCWNDRPCTSWTKAVLNRRVELTLNYRFYRYDQAPDGRQITVEGPTGQVTAAIWVPLQGRLYDLRYVVCNCDLANPGKPGRMEFDVTGTGTHFQPIKRDRTPTSGGTGAGGTGAGTGGGGGAVTTGGSTGATSGGSGGTSGSTTSGGGGAVPSGPGLIKPGAGTGGGIRETGMGWGGGRDIRIGFVGMNYQQGEPIDRKFLNDVGFSVTCPNLSTCQVTATNNTGKQLKFTVCAGVMFVCIPGAGEGAQDTILVQDLRFNLPALGSETKLLKVIRPSTFDLRPSERQVQIQRERFDPNAPTKMPLEGRVLCLNIDKHAPTVKDTFGISLPPSGELAAIANKTMIQPIQGPWDQARIWIVTDAATFDRINKRLIPPIAAAQYVRCLQECADWAGIDLTREPYRKCLEPKLALGIEAGPKALEWFGRTMAEVDAAGLASFVESHLADFAAKYSDAKALDHADRIAALASGMISSENPECVGAAFDLLLKGMPEVGRAQFAKHKGLGALTTFLLTSEDPALVAKALDVVEALKPRSAAIGLLNLRPNLPQALRDRAKSMAGAL